MSLSESVRDLQVALNTIVKLEKELNDKKLINDVKEAVKTAEKAISDATGGALHRLNVSKPSIDAVKELVERIPDALSFKNKKGQLPIQSAVWYIDSTKYVPILAKVGIKHEIGGRGMRGGLLAVDPRDEYDYNTLQIIVNICNVEDPIPHDTARLKVLKELRKDNLLLQSDIKDHGLLYDSCHPTNTMRFEYLAEWDPDNLMNGTFNEMPISHAIIKDHKDLDRFTIYFQTALKYHPQHLGMLFQKDSSGKTAFDSAIEKHETEKTFNVIRQCIPTDTDLPILHHVVRDAPKYINDFTMRYISAAHLRNADGRTLTQVELISGSKTFKNDTMFYVKMTDDEIGELDPVTKQYPFLTCATGETSDLSTIYVLLSRNPSLLEKYIEQTTDEFAEEARSRKRTRDSDNENDGDDEA